MCYRLRVRITRASQVSNDPRNEMNEGCVGASIGIYLLRRSESADDRDCKYIAQAHKAHIE